VNKPSITRYRVALAKEWRGANLEVIWYEIASCCARYKLSVAGTDQYAAAANAALAKRYGLTLQKTATTLASKVEDFTNFATLVHTDCVELPPDRLARRDLLSVKKRATQAGYNIVLPRTSDGRHCDLAAAIVGAVSRAAGRGNAAGAYAEAREHRAGVQAVWRPDGARENRGHIGDGQFRMYPLKDRGRPRREF
jgi:hypothetical protein